MSAVKAVIKPKRALIKKRAVKEVVVEVSLPKGAERMRSGRVVLNDSNKLENLPESGRCTCGSKPITWQQSSDPSKVWYCHHVMHGNNGRFWSDAGVVVIKTRSRKK